MVPQASLLIRMDGRQAAAIWESAVTADGGVSSARATAMPVSAIRHARGCIACPEQTSGSGQDRRGPDPAAGADQAPRDAA
jgi:hypothetical protein